MTYSVETDFPSLRIRLRQAKRMLAIFSIIPALEIVELAAIAGLDAIILDTEHGSSGSEALGPLIVAAKARRLYSIVRVRANEPSLIAKALDAGADGVLVPQIGSLEEALRAIRAARFAPTGTRGANPWVRAANYSGSADWFESANADTAVLLMVEGEGGVQALAEIIELPDLDGIFFGPVDLSHALGVAGLIDHPLVVGTIERAIAHTSRAGMAAGVFSPTARGGRVWLERGATLIAVGVDTAHIKAGFTRIVDEMAATSGTSESVA
jgi:4-hydroxy-2-oxoheptanedioate aldolase